MVHLDLRLDDVEAQSHATDQEQQQHIKIRSFRPLLFGKNKLQRSLIALHRTDYCTVHLFLCVYLCVLRKNE